jgi:hypothetical protein
MHGSRRHRPWCRFRQGRADASYMELRSIEGDCSRLPTVYDIDTLVYSFGG